MKKPPELRAGGWSFNAYALITINMCVCKKAKTSSNGGEYQIGSTLGTGASGCRDFRQQSFFVVGTNSLPHNLRQNLQLLFKLSSEQIYPMNLSTLNSRKQNQIQKHITLPLQLDPYLFTSEDTHCSEDTQDTNIGKGITHFCYKAQNYAKLKLLPAVRLSHRAGRRYAGCCRTQDIRDLTSHRVLYATILTCQARLCPWGDSGMPDIG